MDSRLRGNDDVRKKLKMKNLIQTYDAKLAGKYPRLRQWLWFVALWCFGFAAVSLLALAIKSVFWIGGADI
jgi:hypothetical protein